MTKYGFRNNNAKANVVTADSVVTASLTVNATTVGTAVTSGTAYLPVIINGSTYYVQANI